MKRYNAEPNYAAAQGYEAFMLAAHASVASRTAAPLVLATTIRLAPSWTGLFGSFSFGRDGDMTAAASPSRTSRDRGLQTEFAWEGAEE